MPPRHHYWTIILEGKPTAFRAHTQEELIPTLRQLQARHPDAVLKWFARGRLWETQEEERTALERRRRPKPAASGDRRPHDWRPGGEHKDPRDRFKVPRDEKRRRFASKLRRERDADPKSASASRDSHPTGRRDSSPMARRPRAPFRRNPRGGNRGGGGGSR
jgi:hypothetical protein